MKIYYHINKENCTWKIGDEIEFGTKSNLYWRFLANKGDSININGEDFEVYKIVNAAYDEYIKEYPPPAKMKGYHFNPIRTLKESIDSLGNALKICREISFESIRKDFYPKLPSRQKCIWLIPNNGESLEFWKNVIKNKQRRIFKVAVEGNIHRAAQEWLVGGTFSVNRWNEMAHNYWKGENSGTIQDEVLFCGKIKILDEIF